VSHWIAQFLAKYSLAALGLGTFFEGEGFLVAAGVLVNQGKLQPLTVLLVAAAGAWFGHLFWFAVGRYIGRHHALHRFPKWEEGLTRADRLILRRPLPSIILLQYMYGMRMAGALALGFSTLNFGWFALVEAANCLVWAGLIGLAGYALGESASSFIEWSSKTFLVLIVLIVVTSIGIKLLQRRRLQKH
jgi:membrane protein DedA with SNARE-associated domain